MRRPSRPARIGNIDQMAAILRRQCSARLPNGGGYLCCAELRGHRGPHRTSYIGDAAAVGDPAWYLPAEA